MPGGENAELTFHDLRAHLSSLRLLCTRPLGTLAHEGIFLHPRFTARGVLQRCGKSFGLEFWPSLTRIPPSQPRSRTRRS